MRITTLLLPLTLLAQQPAPVENEWAKVIFVTSRPGPKGQLHKHAMNRVMIYLDKATNSLEFEDGKSKVISASPGEVQFDPKGGMHTSQNTGSAPFRIVEIELKKEGGPVTWSKDDMMKVGPKIYTVELENSQVRVLRIRLAPHQKVPEHEHVLSYVAVPLTELNAVTITPDGTKATSKAKAGEAIFGNPKRHHEENLLDKPVEVLLVEFKG